MTPDFLNDFAVSFGKKQETMRFSVLKGKLNPLQNQFKKHFDSHWVSLGQTDRFLTKPSGLGVMAVDSSVYTNPLSTGGIFYVIRSLAVCRTESRKLLETDVVFTKAGLPDVQRFVGAKMELLEFQVAVEALNQGFGCGRILIDGSLYGRAVHLIVESDIEGQRLMLLDYLRVFREFLDICKSKGVLPIGVSKESRADFYRNYLLRLMFDEELESLAPRLDPLVLQRLKPLFLELLGGKRKQNAALRKFSKLRQKCGMELDVVAKIFEELTSSRPDYQLVMNSAKAPGYTQPLLLGPSDAMTKRFKSIQDDPQKYVRTNFPVSVREKGKDFVDYASNILLSLSSFPGIASFHLLLDVRDSPMRIDVPCWDKAFVKTGRSKPVDLDVNDLLRVMVTGYCGLDGHNLWLKNVDERVRLKKRVVDTIYFPLMERAFGEKIIRGRSYRRVRYP